MLETLFSKIHLIKKHLAQPYEKTRSVFRKHIHKTLSPQLTTFTLLIFSIITTVGALVQNLSVQELLPRLEKNEIILIDVREPAEHRSECIEGACLIPLNQLSLDKISTDDRPIVVHCRSGKRSQIACEELLKQNPTLKLYSLEGGISAWKDAGYKLKQSGKSILPLERQTQLAAGLLVFLGVILGTFVNSWFYMLSGFAGLGLMFAGITGWCGMALLLAQMPWNQ